MRLKLFKFQVDKDDYKPGGFMCEEAVRKQKGLLIGLSLWALITCSMLCVSGSALALNSACPSEPLVEGDVYSSFADRYYRTTSRSHLMSRERFKEVFWTLDPKTQACILGQNNGENHSLSRGEFISIIAPNQRGATPHTRASSDCGIGRSRKSCVLSMRMIINDGLWTPVSGGSSNSIEALDTIDEAALERLEKEMAPARLQVIGDVLKNRLNSFRDNLLEERYTEAIESDERLADLKEKKSSLQSQFFELRQKIYDRLSQGMEDHQMAPSDRTSVDSVLLLPGPDPDPSPQSKALDEAQEKFSELISESLATGEVDEERFSELKENYPQFKALLEKESTQVEKAKQEERQAIEDTIRLYEVITELAQTRAKIGDRPQEIRDQLEEHFDRSLFYEDGRRAVSSSGLMGPELFQCIVEREVSGPNPSERDAVKSVLLEDALQEAIDRRRGQARVQLAIEKKELDRLSKLLAQDDYQPLAPESRNQQLRQSYQKRFQSQVEVAKQKSKETKVSHYLPDFESGYQDRYRHKRYNNLLKERIRDFYSEEEAERLLKKVEERSYFFEENLRYHPYRLNYQFCERRQPRYGSTAYGFAQFTYKTFKDMCSRGKFRYSSILAGPCEQISNDEKLGELSEEQAEVAYSELYHSSLDSVPMQVDMMVSHIYFHSRVQRGVSQGTLSYQDIASSVRSYYGSQSSQRNKAYGAYVSSCHRRRLKNELKYASDEASHERIEKTLTTISR